LVPLLFTLLMLGCTSSTEPDFYLWEGVLKPVPPSTISGVTAAVSQFGRTEVSVEIRQAQADAVFGWRVNAGTCQSEGVIRGGVGAYPNIETDESGIGAEDAILSGLFRSGESYAVRVYADQGGGAQTVVTCGDLEETVEPVG
jgi:hypothetical protein